jgi:hypothetical protein
VPPLRFFAESTLLGFGGGPPTSVLGFTDAAAREMPQVGLSEALELLVLIHARDRTRFSRAALRWHSRFERELDVTTEESQAALVRWSSGAPPGAEALVRRGTS